MEAKRNQDLRNLMFINRVSQKELGRELGVTQVSISRMLNKTPLTAAERARLMNGIDEVIRNR